MDIKEFDQLRNFVEEKRKEVISWAQPFLNGFSSDEATAYEDDLIEYLDKLEDAVSEFACYKQAFENELKKRGLIK